jgi:hypothetical protein
MSRRIRGGHDVEFIGDERIQKTTIGLWEFVSRYAPGKGVQVVNVWHYHLKEPHLAVLEVLDEPEECHSGAHYANVGGRQINFRVKGREAVKEREAPNPWRCPKCGCKPPDGALMMATLKGAPL